MTNKNEVLDGSELERIRGLMADIVDKSSKRTDACVYRGEPECYPRVSSGLFRALCPDSANEAFDIARVEEEMVADARRYTTLAGDEEILTEIQHFGGKTNLIDFTDDYLIALFFASVENEQTDGRVVLHWPEPESVLRPKHTINRVVSQRSVFVRPRRGFILPDASQETVLVPHDLKGSILTYLERFHGISKTTVYDDLHGFIRHQAPTRSQYARTFRESLSRPRPNPIPLGPYLNGQWISAQLERIRHAYHQRGMMYEDSEGSLFSCIILGNPDLPEHSYWYLNAEEIVDLFTHLIENNKGAIKIGEAYCRRGEAYLHQGAVDLAIRDFAEALDSDPEMPEAYHGRGNACRDQGNVDRAMADLEEAIRLKPELVAPLVDRGNMHRESGSLDRAIEDLDTVIARMRVKSSGIGDGDGYFYRAVARCARQDWGEAKSDFETARQKGVLVASSFCAIFGGVPDFEARYGVRVPSDLATMLHTI